MSRKPSSRRIEIYPGITVAIDLPPTSTALVWRRYLAELSRIPKLLGRRIARLTDPAECERVFAAALENAWRRAMRPAPTQKIQATRATW